MTLDLELPEGDEADSLERIAWDQEKDTSPETESDFSFETQVHVYTSQSIKLFIMIVLQLATLLEMA